MTLSSPNALSKALSLILSFGVELLIVIWDSQAVSPKRVGRLGFHVVESIS